MGLEVAKVEHREFDETAFEGFALMVLGGKAVGGIFVAAGYIAARDAHYHADGAIEHAEGDDADMKTWEGCAQGSGYVGHADAQGQDIENESAAEDGGEHAIDDVFLLVVPNFVRKDGDNFLGGEFADEGVVEHDAFLRTEACEIGIGFEGTFGAINDKNVFEFETC